MRGEALLVFQSGGPTTVVNATLAGVIEGARSAGFARVLGARRGMAGLLAHDVVDLTSCDERQLEALARTPGAALGTSRERLNDHASDLVLDRLRSLGVTALIAIGGNDTAKTAQTLLSAATRAGYSFAVVHAPKTIDNDLPGNDHTPGYPSAARFLAFATRGLLLDSWSVRELYSFTLLEVQGRNAGWLVAACALANPEDLRPHLRLLLPERPPLSREALIEELLTTQQRLGWLVAVIPETLRDSFGTPIAGSAVRWVDPHGHIYPSSPAEMLAEALERHSGRRVRVIRPGALARSFIPTIVPLDREEARVVGRTAAQWARAGQSGCSVGIERLSDNPYRIHLRPVPLEVLAGRERHVPDEFIAPDGRAVTDAFRRYADPLVGEIDDATLWCGSLL
uniref:Pyrophosphate--fructose 6-phosphate 1-phosphotransferase n=1 Tax=Thermomicrobium roseum TaxID=500 RepID=A0A7C1JWS1_THERO